MGGLRDGVSKLWILRAECGLDMDGYRDEIEAIDALVRMALVRGTVDAKPKIEAAVAEALKHLDPKPRTCNKHDDCDAADGRAKERGCAGATHCHSEDCEECFGC